MVEHLPGTKEVTGSKPQHQGRENLHPRPAKLESLRNKDGMMKCSQSSYGYLGLLLKDRMEPQV